MQVTQEYSNHPCISCARRKVKCDRKSPCTRCLTTGRDCEQPEVRRAPRRPRKAPDSNVLDRVRQLESSLQELRQMLQNSAVNNNQEPATMDTNHGSESSSPEVLDEWLEKLLVEDHKTRYVSSSSWANIADQVSDLRTLLEDDDPNENRLVVNESLSSFLTSTVLPQSVSFQGEAYSLFGLPYLWNAYITYVDFNLKALHIPTTQIIINKALSPEPQTSKNAYCLIAAIKFAAVTALTENDCQSAFNTPRQHLLNLFKGETQCMLRKANFLISQDLTTLQAFIIFLWCNRRHEESRVMWAACGIAIRISESIGLHRDGTSMNLSVFATEMRRRLYWELRVLDGALAEDTGYLSTQGTIAYGDCPRLPLNINDSDIRPADVLFPPERSEATDMTVVLIKYSISKRVLHYHNPESPMKLHIHPGKDIAARLESLQADQALIESRYLPYLNASIPTHRFGIALCKFAIKKHLLLAQYPLFHRPPLTIYESFRDTLFDMSCEILESAAELTRDVEIERYRWLFETFVQWHPVVFLLNDLTRNPMHNEAGRAWKAIENEFAANRGLSSADRSALWRPLETLVEKARNASISIGGTAHLLFHFSYSESLQLGDFSGSLGMKNQIPSSSSSPGPSELSAPLNAMIEFADVDVGLNLELAPEILMGNLGFRDFGNVYDSHSFH